MMTATVISLAAARAAREDHTPSAGAAVVEFWCQWNMATAQFWLRVWGMK